MKKSLQESRTFRLVLLALLLMAIGRTNTLAQQGMLNGEFTINSGGDKVRFSKGNLQCRPYSETWRFANHQYDCIGTGNTHINQSYTDYIDLFGWGTSGYNHGAVCYKPWSTSMNDENYYAYGNSTYNLYDRTGNADWGYHSINSRKWRTLKAEEWIYILNQRNTQSGLRYAKAQVNGINGLILLPDDWSTSYYTLYYPDQAGVGYNTNVITTSQWNTLETHGAVFLPAAGIRGSDSVFQLNSTGAYWSSSCSNSTDVGVVGFDGNSIGCNPHDRHTGRSVRLVCDIYTIAVSPNPYMGGSVSGGGSYLQGENCSLTATPDTGYTFSNWTQDGNVVSEQSSYTFTVTSSKTFVANFALNSYVITASVNPTSSGTITGVGNYNQGTSCTLTAIANEDYVFNNWTENGIVVSTNSTYTFNVTGARALVANFSPNSYAITATANPLAGGTVIGAGTYTQGTSCTLTATPTTGFVFVNWTESGIQVSTNPTYNFEVAGARDLVANFEEIGGNGSLDGVFSVGENATVKFSQGNLQYQASTNIWRFATNQWDYIGEDNANVSSTYNGWIDLFVWGTSGYNHGAVCYQPWSSSTTGSDYYAYGSATYNLYDQTGTADWGYNAISNGGNRENSGWRTLTTWEWIYLFNTRTTASGIRYAKAEVNGVNGVILLPDDWNVDYYVLNNTNTRNADYSSNIVSATQWDSLKLHGAVFLPASGIRIGTSVNDVGYWGHYWSSSYSYSDDAYLASFHSSDLVPQNGGIRYIGGSVRLVRSAQNYSYSINVTANPTEGGAVSGEGTYTQGASCTLTATPNAGYIFVNWTESGTQVSTNATYSFNVTGARTLVANFEIENITFVDENVKSLCIANWDTNGDGELSYAEAAAVTNLGTVFKNNSTITTFDELQYFTGLTSIGDNAFDFCTNLTSVQLPNTIASIGYRAFYHCKLMTAFNIPSSVTIIGNFAFCYCEKLTSIIIPNSVVSIGDNAFANCYGITSVEISDSVVSIGNNAFYFCNKLTSIEIGSSVTSIGTQAFYSCDLLEYITISTDNSVFDSRDNCNAIIQTSTNTLLYGSNSTIVPNTITTIANGAFRGRQITSINIPNSVTTIGSSAFGGNKMLDQITVSEGNAVYDSRDNCNAIIETSTNKLVAGCVATVIPNTVTSIGYYAFYLYDNIETIVIPGSVTTIEEGAFWLCTGLTSLTILSEIPPVLGNNAFYYVTKSLPVYIPCGTVDAYQSASGWSEFTNYQELECPSFEITATVNPTAGGTITGAGTYTQGASCTLTTTPNAGYAFANWTEGNTVVSNEATYSFTVTGARDLVANFVATGPITPHWTPVTGMLNNMTIEGVVLIDGVEQTSPTLELGAFCGDECRGTVLPFEDGGQWWYFILISGEGGDMITFRLFDHTTMQELESQFVGTIEFVADDDIDPYEFNFANNVTITAIVNPAEAGIVSGAGEYLIGSSATLTVAANEGYAFRNWTVDDNVVSTESTYTFTVTTAITVNANFDRVQNEVLPAGWNWWSTYIEQEDINGLTMLENGLGEAGIMVKAQNSYVKRRANGSWMGSLASITNEDGYKINVSANCSANVTGTPVVASDHPITIKPNWTWIGYPVNVQQTVVVALSGYQPVVGDMIKGASGFAKYRSNGWMPSSFMLEPGKSYMYNSKATENKTLVYSTSRAGTPDETPVEKYWDNDIHTYPDNITMIAVVNLNGEELRDDNAELGAFVGFECRGSARLFHDVETDRYLAMITITGEDGDLIDFGIVNNKRTVMGSATPITFHADDMLGDFDVPEEIVFGAMSATGFKVYPNPVGCGQPVVLNLPEDETVAELTVTNALGVTVLRDMANGREMSGLTTPGVYMIQVVCKSGNKYHERIIVK